MDFPHGEALTSMVSHSQEVAGTSREVVKLFLPLLSPSLALSRSLFHPRSTIKAALFLLLRPDDILESVNTLRISRSFRAPVPGWFSWSPHFVFLFPFAMRKDRRFTRRFCLFSQPVLLSWAISVPLDVLL